MKTSKLCRSTRTFGFQSVLLAAMLTFGLPAALWAGQGNVGNPGVLPPQSHAYGKSYAEWSAEWWQWAYSLPGTNHPLFDSTGAFVGAGQSGKVWFLSGTYSTSATQLPQGGTQVVGTATRTATIPAGKALFFPILNSQNDNFRVNDENNQTDPFTYTEEELREFAAFAFDNGYARNVRCTIDQRPVNGLQDPRTSPYRVQSTLFQYIVPAGDNLYEAQGFHISGPVPPPGAVSDGIYLMLAPLPVGLHEITFGGEFFIPGATPAEDFLFSLDITYILTVAPGNK